MKSKWGKYKQVFGVILLFQEFKSFGLSASGWQIMILPNMVMGAAAPKPLHNEDSHPLMGVGATPLRVAPGQGGFLISCNLK